MTILTRRWAKISLAIVAGIAIATASALITATVLRPGGQTSAASAVKLASGHSTNRQFLSVLTAGSLEATSTGAGTQRVTLSQLDANGTWFTDRPNRDAGSAPVDTILTKFFSDYPTDPPNVVVAMVTESGPRTVVVEFSDPHWDGNVLQFTSTALSGEAHSQLPESATDISITIDGGWQSCEVLFVSQYEDQPITNVSVSTSYGHWSGITTKPPYDPSGSPNQYPVYVQGDEPVSWATSWIAQWSGSFAEGCGGSATATINCGGEQTATVDFQNPEIGSDQYNITTQGAGASLDAQGSTTSGNAIVLQIDVGCDGYP